jgi:hypothetical protein
MDMAVTIVLVIIAVVTAVIALARAVPDHGASTPLAPRLRAL